MVLYHAPQIKDGERATDLRAVGKRESFSLSAARVRTLPAPRMPVVGKIWGHYGCKGFRKLLEPFRDCSTSNAFRCDHRPQTAVHQPQTCFRLFDFVLWAFRGRRGSKAAGGRGRPWILMSTRRDMGRRTGERCPHRSPSRLRPGPRYCSVLCLCCFFFFFLWHLCLLF